jgi:hypothetical protein
MGYRIRIKNLVSSLKIRQARNWILALPEKIHDRVQSLMLGQHKDVLIVRYRRKLRFNSVAPKTKVSLPKHFWGYPKPKRKVVLENYEPEIKPLVRRENAVPFFVGVCSKFVVLGGAISFIASSIIMGIKGYFQAEEEIKKFSWDKKKVVEIRVKNGKK